MIYCLFQDHTFNRFQEYHSAIKMVRQLAGEYANQMDVLISTMSVDEPPAEENTQNDSNDDKEKDPLLAKEQANFCQPLLSGASPHLQVLC
jgi:hypothetical protein